MSTQFIFLSRVRPLFAFFSGSPHPLCKVLTTILSGTGKTIDLLSLDNQILLNQSAFLINKSAILANNESTIDLVVPHFPHFLLRTFPHLLGLSLETLQRVFLDLFFMRT